MTPDTLVYDLDLPRRPSLDDVGGAQKEDDAQFPPDPRTMLTAADWNQVSKLVAGLARVSPLAVISVEYDDGAPVVSKLLTPGSKLSPESFTMTHNDTGDLEISWESDALPVPGAGPSVTVNEDTPHMATVVSVTNGVRVRTWDSSGVAADAAFTVFVY